MKRLLPLLLLVVIPAPSTALADGCPSSTCGITSSAVPGSSILFVRSYGPNGPLQAFDIASGKRRFSLPQGVLSADGRMFIAAASARRKRTTIARFDARSGTLERDWSLRRRWDVVAVAPNGNGFILGRADRLTTTFRVGSTRFVLQGFYEAEAVSPDGGRLFLVHWTRTGYELQQLDLASGRLSPTRLDDPDEKMSGTATTAVTTRDGSWLLTLYSKDSGESFVHALDLRSGVAHCIDLPITGDYFLLGSSALTLSPDEKKLYVASPYLGRVTTVDLERLSVTRVVRFRGLSQNAMSMTGPSGAMTPNGRMLAIKAARSLWLYDAAYGIVRRATRTSSGIVGVGFRTDGRRLLVLQRRGAPVFLDAATGARQ